MALCVFRYTYKSLQESVIQNCIRCLCSQSTPSIQNKAYGKNFELRYIDKGRRPLVLLFSWMLAKQRHIDKYGNFYISRGFDVLTVKLKPSEVISPLRAQATMLNLSKVLEGPLKDKQKMVVHGFSVGGYVYSELLVQIHQNPLQHSELRQRLVAQIFDSPVDFDGVSRGFANVLTENPLLRKTINALLALYLKMFQSNVMHHYLRASEAFKANELKLPTLMLYSKSDPIGCAKIIESVIADWENRKEFLAYNKSWENTPHVSHFHKHPDEYIDMVLMFLHKCNLIKDELQPSVAIEMEIKDLREQVENP